MTGEKEYLNDATFLKYIAGLHIKNYLVKITILDWEQNQIKDIHGKVLTASINIDGNSTIRRSATLSVYIDDTNNDITSAQNILSINKKVNLQIGFLNNTEYYLDYPTLWFPLGIYVILGNSISYSESGLTASLQLKDKMCLLNGECGGTLPAATVFDNYITVDENGDEVVERPTIYMIIQELVNHFGGQQLGKIIISDLDTRVKQVVKWTGTTPLFLYKKNGQFQYSMQQQQDDTNVYKDWPKEMFQYGEDVGFIYTDFTFPGDLIGDAGNTVTDILDQITEVLGNYEYFYDIDGNFVFQQIKNYLNNAQSKYILDILNNKKYNNKNTLVPDYIKSLAGNNDLDAYLIDINNGTSAFEFNDSFLVSSYSNTPQYSAIKNDFVVWGVKTTTQGTEIPIRYHLAIDEKPLPGNTYQIFQYKDPLDGSDRWYYPISIPSIKSLPEKGTEDVCYKIENNIYIWNVDEQKWINTGSSPIKITTVDWRTQLFCQGLVANTLGTDSNYYFAELHNEWPKIYDIKNNCFYDWVINNPSQIDFYLDFIDCPSSAIAELNVKNIGRRTKVLNQDKNVNCIFESWIPDLILIQANGENTKKLRNECEDRGQPFNQVNSQIYSAFEIGGSRYSAYEEIRQLIHEYTKYNQSISLQTLPIYHLEPNTRITVKNAESNIYGDYIIQSLSLTLDNSSMLTINAIKAPEKI